MSSSKYLGSLGVEARAELEQRLLTRQSGRCFICDEAIDLLLHKGQLDVDHIDPLAEDGLDAENNFALTHESCNRNKGAANLQVARRIQEFERLQERAKRAGKRGANLGDVLERHGGAKSLLRLRMEPRALSCASPLTPPMTRSPSTKRRGRGVRRSSSHRPGRRTSLGTARGRPRGIETITLVKQLGRRQWQKASGYHRQGRVENTFFRYKSIIGDGLRARSPAGQGSEVVLGCEILNRMTALGRPVSYRIGR